VLEGLQKLLFPELLGALYVLLAGPGRWIGRGSAGIDHA